MTVNKNKLKGISEIPKMNSDICEGSGECDDCELFDCYYNETEEES